MQSKPSISSNTVTTHLRNKEHDKMSVDTNKEVSTPTPIPNLNLTKFTNPLPQGVFPCLHFPFPTVPYEFFFFPSLLPSLTSFLDLFSLLLQLPSITLYSFPSLLLSQFLFLDRTKGANSIKHSSISQSSNAFCLPHSLHQQFQMASLCIRPWHPLYK